MPYAPELGQEKIRTGYKTPAMQRIIWGSPKPAATQTLTDNLLKLCQQAQTLRQKNLTLEQITEQLLGPEDMLAKISKGNFCKANLISEALKVELS